ncbi:MAG: histidine--tRNA ligase [Holosporales bacterium]|jgi:histidyl-tRNA synthetase|nr:histidine--tRNA ligase [Holosporales bacterium]
MAIFQPVRGMHDFLPKEAYRFSCLIEQGRTLARHYGFHEIQTPILEKAEVFSRPLGESSDVVGKEMYLLTDRGGEILALRPEGTASVVRAFLSNGLTDTLPFKEFYTGPMFRYERPQKGRYRQFHQIGIENLGESSPWSDAESIFLAQQYLKSIQIEAFLEINTLGDAASRAAYKEALVAYFKEKRTTLSALSLKRLEQNPLRILDSKEPEDQDIIQQAPTLEAFLTSEARTFFETLCTGLKTLGIAYRQNPRLVRGLDYYTHTVFEFVPPSGEGGTLLAGGHYDHLVELMGGPKMSGFGWAAGLERLSLAACPMGAMERSIAVITVNFNSEAYTCARLLRDQGYIVEVFSGKDFGKLLKKADRNQARYAVILGEEEINTATVSIKDLDNRIQERVPLASLKEFSKPL